MFTSQEKEHGPFTIRYPRGKGVMPEWKTEFKSIEIGTGRKLRSGKDIAILSFGHVGNYATEVCKDYDKDGFHIAHYDLRFAKPLDQKMLHEVFENYEHIITLEDGCITGGVGSAVIEFMADHQYQVSVYRLGIPDAFIEHGPQLQLQAEQMQVQPFSSSPFTSVSINVPGGMIAPLIITCLLDARLVLESRESICARERMSICACEMVSAERPDLATIILNSSLYGCAAVSDVSRQQSVQCLQYRLSLRHYATVTHCCSPEYGRPTK